MMRRLKFIFKQNRFPLRNFKLISTLVASIFLTTAFMVEDFKALQLKYDRVQTAYDQKSEAVFALLV
jgi:hypothetical protein